jgi:hypothetical protein
MTDRTTAEEVRRYAANAARHAEALDALAEAGTVGELLAATDPDDGPSEWAAHFPADDGYDPDMDLWDVLNVDALEVYAVGRCTFHNGWTVTGIVIVTGTGGPHVETEIDYRGRITGRAYWGGEKAEHVEYDAETLFEILAEMFEELAR